MITETLLNSLKSLFSSLGAKTSDNNYAVGLLDKTTAEPKGLMDMSDLASVLGAYGLARMSTYANFNGDMNDIKLNAWGYVTNTTTNAPSGITSFSFLSFCAWSDAPIQIVVGTGGFAIRRILFDQWTPWYKISS